MKKRRNDRRGKGSGEKGRGVEEERERQQENCTMARKLSLICFYPFLLDLNSLVDSFPGRREMDLFVHRAVLFTVRW